MGARAHRFDGIHQHIDGDVVPGAQGHARKLREWRI
jgi:hypothetical protein